MEVGRGRSRFDSCKYRPSPHSRTRVANATPFRAPARGQYIRLDRNGQMKIRTKLGVAMCAVLAFETVTLEYVYLSSSRERQRRVQSMQTDALQPLGQVIRMVQALAFLNASIVEGTLDDKMTEQTNARISESADALQREIVVYEREMSIAVQPEMQRILRLAGALDDQSKRETEAIPAAKREAAQVVAGISKITSDTKRNDRVVAGAAYRTDVLPHLARLQSSLDILSALQHEQGQFVVAQLLDLQRADARTFAVTAVVSMLLGVIAMVFLGRAIVQPVQTLITATEHVTQGDLNARIDVSSRDEIGALARSFQGMTDRLRQSQREIEDSTHMLRESQRNLAHAQQLAEVGSWSWDIRTNALAWSDQQFRMFGLEPGSVAPTLDTYFSFVHPEERAFITESLDHALKSRQPLDYQQRVVRRDGTIRIIHAHGEIITDADGTPVRMVGVGQDITDRVGAEQALRESDERFQLAMLATNDALWDRTPGSKDIWWSDGFFRLFGYAPDAIAYTPESWIGLIHPEDRANVSRTLDEFLASDHAVWTCEYRFRRADGVYAWVFDRGYAVREGGRARRLIGSMMDITARKEAERMKSDFVSFVSHQLRTPLSGMNWMLELAQDTPDLPPIAQDYIAEARASAERLGGLVNDLLDVSRLESGRLVLTIESVDMGALTLSVVDENRALVAAKGHRVVLELGDAVPSVSADAQLLRQAVANLVSNAIKYTPPGGTIVVALGQENGHVRWTVKDSGIGIPAGGQSRLFEKFYRADNALAMETEGTGLGLHLVRLVIEQLGGTVWCDSEEGKGATFGVALPAVAAV